jgi:HK97 family phage major capsid protein
MLQAIETVSAANFTANAVLYNAKSANFLASKKNTLGDFLAQPATFVGLEKFITNQLPSNLGTGLTDSSLFVGQWNELALGLRSSLQIEVSREASYLDTTLATPAYASSFSKDQTVIRAILRADWQVLQPNAFAEITGVNS